MDIVLEVSEIEDYSEFPNIEIQTVEITSKNKQATQHREGRSLASEVSTAEKATQTISRRVWRKDQKESTFETARCLSNHHQILQLKQHPKNFKNMYKRCKNMQSR